MRDSEGSEGGSYAGQAGTPLCARWLHGTARAQLPCLVKDRGQQRSPNCSLHLMMGTLASMICACPLSSLRCTRGWMRERVGGWAGMAGQIRCQQEGGSADNLSCALTCSSASSRSSSSSLSCLRCRAEGYGGKAKGTVRTSLHAACAAARGVRAKHLQSFLAGNTRLMPGIPKWCRQCTPPTTPPSAPALW